jgi:Gametolysin peptidase M11
MDSASFGLVPRRRLAVLAVLVAALVAVPGALAHGTSGFKAGQGAFKGEQRYLMILATWGPQPFSVEQVRDVVFNQTDAFTRRQSFGASWITGDVTPWVPAFTSQPECDTDRIAAQARAAAQRAGYDLAKYNRFGYLFPRNACPFSGMGSAENTWYNGRLSVRLVAHELGHTYGLRHSNTWECTTSCTIVEYGDPYDTMGNGLGDFNVFEKFSIGWITNVTRTAAPGTFTIDRIEQPTLGSHAVVITTASSEYWIYHRLDQLQAPFSSSFLPTGVLVHVGPNPQAPPDQVVYGQDNLLLPNPVGQGRPAIFPGETFAEPGVFQLTVLAQRGNQMDVKFEWTDTTAPKPPAITGLAKRLRAGGTLEISWNDAHELGSGLSHYEVKLDKRTAIRVPVQFAFTPIVRIKKPATGAHTISIVAVDRAGNRSAAATKRFTIFKPKPKRR